MRSRLVPVLDVLFVGMKWRRKAGAGERHLQLYQVFNDSG